MSCKISIIIVNYKGRQYLEACLSSIFENAPESPFEVIVVDNASNDGSLEFIREKFPQVKIVSNKYNYGFAVANNQGFQVSSGEYVMTLNPDAEIIGRPLDKIIGIFDADPKIGIVGSCLLEDSGVVAMYDGYPVISPSKMLKKLGIGRRRRAAPEVPTALKKVSWIWGTGYVCRRSALGRTFFDESTFLFAEEQEICERVRGNNYSIALSPDFVIKHIRSVTYGKDKDKSAVATKLLESACWRARKRRFGTFLANTHQFFRGIDDFMMWFALNVKNRFAERNTGRELEMSNLKAVFTASLQLILKGDRYFEKVNKEARMFFNDGDEIPFPPETL